MANSLFLAQVLGPAFLVIAIALLTHQKTMQAAVAEMTKAGHRMFIFFASIIQLLGGLLLALSHPVWTWGWPVIITLFAWLLIVRSVVMLWFTDSVLAMVAKMRNSSWWLYLGVIVFLVCGVVLTYQGYWM